MCLDAMRTKDHTGRPGLSASLPPTETPPHLLESLEAGQVVWV